MKNFRKRFKGIGLFEMNWEVESAVGHTPACCPHTCHKPIFFLFVNFKTCPGRSLINLVVVTFKDGWTRQDGETGFSLLLFKSVWIFFLKRDVWSFKVGSVQSWRPSQNMAFPSLSRWRHSVSIAVMSPRQGGQCPKQQCKSEFWLTWSLRRNRDITTC